MDQFWPQIGSSFQNVVMRTEGYILLLIVILSIVLVSVVYYIKKRIDSQKEPDSDGFFKIDSRSVMFDLFEAALQFNSRFDLRFHGHSREIFCVFKDYDSSTIFLEPPFQVKIPQRVAGRDVDVFFKVKPQRDKLSFYKFTTTIQDVSTEDNHQILKLHMPEILEMEQKRQHLRLVVPSRYIKRLEVRRVSHDEEGNFHKNLSSFGEPLWERKPDADVAQLGLMDVSGGGLRLKVSTHTYTVDRDFFKINPMLLVSMVFFYDTNQRSSETFHLIGRIKKQYYEGSGNHVLGLQYEFRALFDKKKQVITGWKSVNPDEGVEDLSTWVVKMHLKLFREKGLTD